MNEVFVAICILAVIIGGFAFIAWSEINK